MAIFQRISKALFSCAVYAMILCPTFVHADPPPSGNADAVVNSDTLMDRQIAQSKKVFKPENLAIFQSDIDPILKLADKLPEFGKALKRAMNKKWNFDFDGIKDCPTELSFYTKDFKKVACQNSDEVIINPDWYLNADSDKGKKKMSTTNKIVALKQKQKDLFIHELLLGITLGTSISAESSNEVFSALIRQPLPSASELQTVLEHAHFGVYGQKPDKPCNDPIPAAAPTSPEIQAMTDLVKRLKDLASSIDEARTSGEEKPDHKPNFKKTLVTGIISKTCEDDQMTMIRIAENMNHILGDHQSRVKLSISGCQPYPNKDSTGGKQAFKVYVNVDETLPAQDKTYVTYPMNTASCQETHTPALLKLVNEGLKASGIALSFNSACSEYSEFPMLRHFVPAPSPGEGPRYYENIVYQTWSGEN